MKVQTFNIGTWLYPDSILEECNNIAVIHCARNADACFQILTDQDVPEGTEFSWSYEKKEEGIRIQVYELRPVGVKHNSGVEFHSARDYKEVCHFVTREAPFEIFDLTRSVCDGKLLGGRVAFFVRVDVDKNVDVGKKQINMLLKVGTKETVISVDLYVHKAQLCSPNTSPYDMLHWIYPDCTCFIHSVERGSEAYYEMMEAHMEKLIDMRNNYLQLPTPFAVFDENGTVTGFDFTENDKLTEIALRLGFKHICSGFVCHWVKWDGPEYTFVWDRETEVESVEGYRQLKLYFQGVKEFIARHHLEDIYMQSLVDEPQVPNSLSYKAIVCTFRTMLPNVKLIDPVETPYIMGSCDIWVIKQEVYEKYKGIYNALRNMGETLWVYACGFPANKWMNHILDLPLSATRLGIWQGIRRGMSGYLHYGYMSFSDDMDPMYDTNFSRMYQGEKCFFPPGNGNLIYGTQKQIYESVRFHVQRISAQEGELLLRLKEKDTKVCDEIIDSVCSSFYHYTYDASLVEEARRTLFEKLDTLL